MPDSNPLYELMGGYYPGDPVQRKPPAKGNYPQRVYFNPNTAIDEYMNAVRKEADKLSFNKQIKEKWKKDVERALVAQAKKSSESYDITRAMELGDEEQVAGVNLKVDLNVKKWIDDPQKMAKETVSGWAKDFFNYADLDAYVERKHLWKPLLEGDIDATPPVAQTVFQKDVAEGVEVPPDYQPFQLMGLGRKSPKKTKLFDKTGRLVKKGDKEKIEFKVDGIEYVDRFHETGKKFLQYNDKVRSSGARNGGYLDLNRTGLDAVVREIEDHRNKGNLSAEQVVRTENFVRTSKVFQDVNSINKGLSDISKDLAKIYLGKENQIEAIREKGISVEDYIQSQVAGKLTNKANQIRNYIEESEKLLGGDTKSINIFSNSVFREGIRKPGAQGIDTNKLKQVQAIQKQAQDVFGSSVLKDFQKDMGYVRGILNDIEKLRDDYASGRISAMNLKGKLDLINEKMQRSDVVGGTLDKMNKNIMERHLLSADSEARKVIFGNKHLLGSRSFINVSDEAAAMLFRQNFNDFVDKLEQDGLIGVAADQAWNLVRKRLDGFTPATAVQEAMKRTHYLGLVYDPEYDNVHGGKTGFVNRTFTNMVQKRKIFDNNQFIKFDDGTKFKFIGDKCLKDPVSAFKQTLFDKDHPNYFSDSDFIEFLNNKMGDDRSLKNWFLKYKDELGLKMEKGVIVDSAENKALLNSLFKKLGDRNNESYISIFQNKAGLLQKLSQWATDKRKIIYNSFVGKVVAPFAYARNVLSKKGAKALAAYFMQTNLMQKFVNSKFGQAAAKLLSKLFGSALGALTGGAGKVIWAVLERTFQFVINKAVDFTKKIFESFRKGDIGIIGDFVEEGAAAIFKAIITCSGCMIASILAIMLPVIVMLSAITPVDPTRMAEGIDDPAGSGGGSGATEVCTTPGACNVVATVNCFEFLDSGWPSATHREVIENSANFLAENFGHYVDKLCEDGTIEIVWNPSVACGRARMAAGNRIEFGDQNCYTYSLDRQETFYWLFAHETGHIFHAREYNADPDILSDARDEDCGNSLPTYVGTTNLQCRFDMQYSTGGPEEDFAEMVGNFVMFHKHCQVVDVAGLDRATFFNIDGNNVSASWNNYCPNGFKGHYDFAYENLFSP